MMAVNLTSFDWPLQERVYPHDVDYMPLSLLQHYVELKELSILRLWPNPVLSSIKEVFKETDVKFENGKLRGFLDYLWNAGEIELGTLVERLERVKELLGERVKAVSVDYYEDPEMSDYRKIFIEFTVSGEDLDELQELWDRVIDVFYEGMPQKMVNRFVVSVEPGD